MKRKKPGQAAGHGRGPGRGLRPTLLESLERDKLRRVAEGMTRARYRRKRATSERRRAGLTGQHGDALTIVGERAAELAVTNPELVVSGRDAALLALNRHLTSPSLLVLDEVSNDMITLDETGQLKREEP